MKMRLYRYGDAKAYHFRLRRYIGYLWRGQDGVVEITAYSSINAYHNHQYT